MSKLDLRQNRGVDCGRPFSSEFEKNRYSLENFKKFHISQNFQKKVGEFLELYKIFCFF